MTEQEQQELNKKVAEWAGFTFRPFAPQYATPGEPDPEYVYGPEGRSIGNCPNFPQSLDACFRWLMPKVHSMLGDRSYYRLLNDWCIKIITDGSEPLALCLVIEKLIDKEMND